MWSVLPADGPVSQVKDKQVSSRQEVNVLFQVDMNGTVCVSVFDDGDEKTLRRTSLCLKGERHFAESEVSLTHRQWDYFFRPVSFHQSQL